MSDADRFTGSPGPRPDPGRDDELTRVLERLTRARDDAGRRVDGLLQGVPLPGPADRPAADESARTHARPTERSRERPPSPPSPRASEPLRSPAGRMLHAVARPVAALVLTATAVLGGWLFVLEPALGSRPVLVRDEGMSPSLRTGDVALASTPDGPLASGTLVAVRLDGRRVVTRVIGREQLPPTAGTAARAGSGLVVRADAEPLEVSAVVPLEDLIGEVGVAVPRVGLPVVLLAAPGTSPLGAAIVAGLLGLTAVGARDLARERRRSRE